MERGALAVGIIAALALSGCSEGYVEHVDLKWTMDEVQESGSPTEKFALVVRGGPWKRTLLKPKSTHNRRFSRSAMCRTS